VQAEVVWRPQGFWSRSRAPTLLQDSFLQPLWGCFTRELAGRGASDLADFDRHRHSHVDPRAKAPGHLARIEVIA
jgi:hypothetical protein